MILTLLGTLRRDRVLVVNYRCFKVTNYEDWEYVVGKLGYFNVSPVYIPGQKPSFQIMKFRSKEWIESQ